MHRFLQRKYSSLSIQKSNTDFDALQVIREMDMVEKVVREACARSSDGKISITDFSEQASRSMRYVTFSPMEVSIIFHYAGQGSRARLGLKEFAQLLDPKWGPPKVPERKPEIKGSFLHELGKVCQIA